MTDWYFAAPGWLWLLLLLPVAAFFLCRRNWKIGTVQTLMLLALIAAAAQPYRRFESAATRRILLLEAGADPAGIPAAYAGWERRPFTGSPAAVLTATAAELPDGGGALAVYGTLVETDGSLDATRETLAERRIAVTAVPAPNAVPDAPVVRELRYPASAGVGATVAVGLTVESARVVNAVLTLTDAAGAEAARRETVLTPGVQTVTLELNLPQEGPFHGTVTLDGQPVGAVAIAVRKPFRALLFSSHPEVEQALFQQLFGRAVTVDTAGPGQDLTEVPLLLLGEGAAATLSPGLRREIARRVRDGAGLFAVSGREAVFAIEAVEPEFAALFPVRYDGEKENKLPTVALVVILDTSGSMRGPRIDLARETARLALENLGVNDLAGIVEFHGARRWAAPLQSAANQFSLMRALNRLNSGGGTVILPAIEEAYYVLRNADARLKHVLILTDGGVEYGDFESVIRRMAREDITVSTVLVGPGESQFLSQLATWGNGRFFRASSRFALPDLQFRPQNVKPLPPYLEGKFALAAGTSPVVAALPAPVTVTGFVKSRPVDRAEVLLAAEALPVLAVYRTGLGATAVLNTQLNGNWSAELNALPAYPAMLTALVRTLPDRLRFDGIAAWNRSVNRDLDFEFEVAEPRPELTVSLESTAKRLGAWTLAAAPDGTFRFRLPQLPEGVYTVKSEDYHVEYPFVSRRAPEHSPVAAPVRAKEWNAVATAAQEGALAQYVPLAPWLGLAGTLLFLVQLGARRYVGKLAALLLVLGAVLPGGVSAAAYDDAFRAAIVPEEAGDFAAAAGAYARAAEAAETDGDRDFATILEWENARRAGTLPALLEEWLQTETRSDLQSELVLAALEERGENTRAWELARTRFREHPETADALFRLAERAGQYDWLRDRLAAAPADDDDAAWLRLELEVRLALLREDRETAKRLYRERLTRTTATEFRLEIARAAEAQALYDVAEEALQLAAGTEGGRDWPALFQLVNLYRTTGRPDAATALLRSIQGTSDADPAVLLTAGDLSEQLGARDTALAFYAASGLEDAVMRAAALEAIAGNVEAARKAWEQLALAGPTEMRALQAVEQLVELYRKAGKLETYRQELETRVAAPDASERLIALYIRVLAASGDNDRLFAFLAAHGRDDAILNYRLELQQYPEAAALLRRTIAQHPEQAEAAWRKLAMIAVETRDGKLAAECLEQLRQGDRENDSGYWEFAGAVYALSGDPRHAADSYRRALELNPQKSELLLLWAKSKQALGEGKEALDLFQTQLPGERSPERFGVLVDGLLNLSAPRPLLEQALQQIRLRIQDEPENLFYYQLAEDLVDELNLPEQSRHLERLQLAVAPERRSLLIQKLFLDARRRNADAEALYYGRILMALQEKYSPEIYRALGSVLVEQRFFAAAERCMRDADRSNGGTENLAALAEILSRRHGFADAGRIYRELLILTPDRADLLEKYATMLEFEGRYPEAAEADLKALQLLAAPLAGTGDDAGRGTAGNDAWRRFRHLIPAFANQAIMTPGTFQPRLRELQRQASNPAQQKAWQAVLDRLALLMGEPEKPENKAAEVKEKPAASRPEGPSARTLAAELRRLPAPEAASRVTEIFSALPEARRESYWCQLLETLDFEPSPEVTAVLTAELEKLSPDSPSSIDWVLPYGVALKKAYAERLLTRHPDDPAALAPAARMRHLAGDGESARMLAEMLYEEWETQEEPGIPEVRLLFGLGRIYAATPGEEADTGVKALRETIAAREEARRTLGDTPQRLLILGSLYSTAGDYDRAQELLGAAWDLDRNDYALFWALRDAAERSGRWEDWAELLAQRAPTDQTAAMLYTMQLGPYWRGVGAWRQANELLPGLNPVLQARERLLLAFAQGEAQPLAAEFMDFLRSSREERSGFTLIDRNRYTGGILGHQEQNRRFSQVLFIRIASEVPECRPYLEYLFQGTASGDYAFTLLWRTLRAMPGTGDEGKLPRNTLAASILRAGSAPGSLSAAERETLLRVVQTNTLPMELNVEILRLLPKPEAAAEAAKLADRLIPGRGFVLDEEELTPLLELLTPEELDRITATLAAAPCELGRSDAELQRLKLLRRFAPERFRTRLQKSNYGSDSLLILLARPDPVAARNYLLQSEEYPDWEAIAALAGNDVRWEKMTQSFAEALETLGKDHVLPPDRLVRHYALLAVSDRPERRAQWLERAFAHHQRPSAASVWLYDALVANGETAKAEQLQTELEREHRFPLARKYEKTIPKGSVKINQKIK